MIECPECKVTLMDGVILDMHMKKVHNKVQMMICKLCEKKIRNNDTFDRHLQYVHGTNHWDLVLAMRDFKKTYKDLI